MSLAQSSSTQSPVSSAYSTLSTMPTDVSIATRTTIAALL